MIEKDLHQVFVTAHDRFMQRSKTGPVRVGIRAFFEQKLHDVRESGMSREHYRAHAPGIFVVDVGAGSHKQLGRSQIVHPRRKHQCRVVAVRNRAVVLEVAVRRHSHHLSPRIRTGVNIGAIGEQDLDDFRMLLGHGPHQRRLASRCAGIDVGALRGQQFHDGRTARSRGHHHGRLAQQKRGIRIGARR